MGGGWGGGVGGGEEYVWTYKGNGHYLKVATLGTFSLIVKSVNIPAIQNTIPAQVDICNISTAAWPFG